MGTWSSTTPSSGFPDINVDEGQERNKEETFSEMQGRKTAMLLERTPMSIATAIMPII